MAGFTDLGIGGGMVGSSLIGAGSQSKTNQEMMDFAERMSSTQYQRAVEDMRAAGLNPVLAAGTGGSSASTPSLQAPGKAIESGLSGAIRTLGIDKPVADANVKQTEATTEVAKKEAENKVKQGELIKAQTDATRANAQGTWADNKKKQTLGNLWDPLAQITADPAAAAEKGTKTWKKVHQDVKDAAPFAHGSNEFWFNKATGKWQQGKVTLDDKDQARLDRISKDRKPVSVSDAYASGFGAVYGGKNNAKGKSQ